MLVWRDVSGSGKKRRPSWLDTDADFSSAPCTEGYLWTPTHYASLLTFRPDATWTDVGDGWSCSLYDTFEPRWYVRQLKCSLWIDLEDVDGTMWSIPALLRPDGLPAIGMRNKASICDGMLVWDRLAPSDRLARALECAQDMRPHCETNFENMDDPAQLINTMIAVIESAYNLNLETIACMGLIGDTLLYQGCKFTCAVITGE